MGLEEYEAIGRSVAAHGGTLADVLEHHGIRGMKWGVRRSRKQIDSAPDAPEHTRARELHSVARKHGTRKLSNQDLNELNKRLNLEQNYGNLTAKTKSKASVGAGAKWLGDKALKFGDMAVDTVVRSHMQVEMAKRGLIPTGNGGGR